MAVRRSIQIVLFVILLIIAVLLAGYAIRNGGTYRPSEDAAAAPSPSPSVAGPVLSLLVIGDSAAAGAGASVPGRAWVDRVAGGSGWEVTNRSVRGAGYLARTAGEGDCDRGACPSFASILERLRADVTPDVVLVAGGRGDLEASGSLDKASRAFFAAARKAFPEATIVALDPAYDETSTPPSSLPADEVRRAVRRVDGRFADVGQPLAQHPERVAADGVQPNDTGHRIIARAVLAELRRLNVG